MKCDHIPQIIEYDSYDGNYEEYENDIYAAYQSTFESQEFSWGKNLFVKRNILCLRINLELFGTLFQAEILKKAAYQTSEDTKE